MEPVQNHFAEILPRIGWDFAEIPVRGPTEHSLSYRAPTLDTLGAGAGGGQTQGEKCGFWTNFFSTVASRGRNPANKKSHPRQVSYLSNEVEIDRNGG